MKYTQTCLVKFIGGNENEYYNNQSILFITSLWINIYIFIAYLHSNVLYNSCGKSYQWYLHSQVFNL